jgi:hypothetical protein
MQALMQLLRRNADDPRLTREAFRHWARHRRIRTGRKPDIQVVASWLAGDEPVVNGHIERAIKIRQSWGL